MDNSKSNYNIIGFILLLVCSFKLLYQTSNYLDVEFSDEGMYLRYGLNMFDKIEWYWGPSYNLWYKLLSIFTKNPVQLYYLNFIVLSVSIPVLVYFFLIRIQVKTIVALFVSFCFLTSTLHLMTFAKVSHFAVMIFLIGLIISTYLSSKIYKLSIVFCAVLIASFARPELILTLFLLTLLGIFICLKESKIISKIELFAVCFICVVLGANLYFSKWNSFEFLGYKREVWAFYDHYTLKMSHNIYKNSNHFLYWEDVAKERFNSTKNMIDLFLHYPKIMFQSSISNFLLYVASILLLFSSLILPYKISNIFASAQIISIVLILLFLGFSFIPKKTRSKNITALRENSFYLLMLFFYGIPSFISCCIILPRQHYIYQQIPFFILVCCILVQNISTFEVENKKKRILILIFLMLLTPRIFEYKQTFIFKTYKESKQFSLCYKQLIHFFNNYKPKYKHVIFSNIPMVDMMLNANYKSCNTLMDKRMNVKFDSFLIAKKIDIIIFTPQLITDSHLETDSSWIYFSNNFEKYHFKKITFSADCDLNLLIKE